MRIYLLAIAISVVLVLLGAWAYFFVFGTPKSIEGVFANFGGGSASEFEPVAENTTGLNEENEVATPSTTLRQLATKPIAGMTFVSDGTVRYVEQGTGHIFDVQASGGAETQVTNTTFTRVREALFSPDGSSVVLTYEENGMRRNIIGKIDGQNLTTASLLSGAYDFSFSNDGKTLYYLIETSTGTEGQAYAIDTKRTSRLFSAPFGSLRALWGDHTYLYTKPAASLLGYAYEVKGGVLSPVAAGEFGLMTEPFSGGIVITKTDNGTLRSKVYSSEVVDLGVAAIPEKCTDGPGSSADLVCAAALDFQEGTYPDDWYKGAVTLSDSFWKIDTDTGEAEHLANGRTETGRTIDVEKIMPNEGGTEFLIMNKTNSTLWLFTPEL